MVFITQNLMKEEGGGEELSVDVDFLGGRGEGG